MTTEPETDGVIDYLFEIGLLKRSRRTGWWVAGVRDPESVAEHSFRTAVVGSVLAMMEGADPGRVSMLCLFHDTPETRLGDIPYVGKRYLTAAPATDVTRDQLTETPHAVRDGIRGIVEELERSATPEARIARDADKLECLLQALEYRAQGYDVQSWIDNMVAAVTTRSAREIAARAVAVSPQRWHERYQH